MSVLEIIEKAHPIYDTSYIKIFTDSRGYIFAILRLEKIWVPDKFNKSFRMGWAPSSCVTAHIFNSNLLLRLSCFTVVCYCNEEGKLRSLILCVAGVLQ